MRIGIPASVITAGNQWNLSDQVNGSAITVKGIMMSNVTVVGIDPGAYGAVVGVYADGSVEMETMPLTKHKTIDCIRVGEFIDQLSHTDLIIVWENVHSMPQQGVASTFKFGLNTGMVVGAVISRATGNGVMLSEHKVSPQRWKKHHGLTRKPKAAAIGKMKEYLPNHDFSVFTKKHLEGIADAFLISRWFMETELGQE